MSLSLRNSLRNRLSIALCPSHIAVASSARGWWPRASKPRVSTFTPSAGEPGWRAPVAALSDWLAQETPASADVEVIVSDCFARYVLIPWSGSVQKSSELAAMSRIHFEALFGTSASGWRIQLDCGDYQKPGIACAIDAALVDALQELFALHGLRRVSLQPHFMHSFNRWRSRIGDDALFVLVESGQCICASFTGGHWHSIRTIRLEENREAALSTLIEREILLQGLSEKTAVYLHALEPVATTALRRDFTVLKASASAAGQLAGVAMLLNAVI